MSFTAEVKDELARVGGSCPECAVAELAALVRVCGALSFHGSGAYSIRVSTETGPEARTVHRLAHQVFDRPGHVSYRAPIEPPQVAQLPD